MPLIYHIMSIYIKKRIDQKGQISRVRREVRGDSGFVGVVKEVPVKAIKIVNE